MEQRPKDWAQRSKRYRVAYLGAAAQLYGKDSSSAQKDVSQNEKDLENENENSNMGR